MSALNLATVPDGQPYRITGYAASSIDAWRLMELGFHFGEIVAVMQRTPLKGLLKVKIKATRFALCHKQAQAILVEPCASCTP